MSATDAVAADLRSHVRGGVLVRGAEGFSQACRPWNLAIDQRVLAVVEAADVDDIRALVRYARSAGLAIAVQPSGHGATGDVEGVVLLRTSRLDDLEVRSGERVARAGAGVKWGQVLAAVGPHGLTGLPGSSPVVSVVGYTLGGGLSWFSRRYGLASSSARAFDVVDADGTRSTVTASSDPDLYWALRGGGGDFALVTAVEFDLHPAPALYGGRMLWPAERAPDVLDAFRAATAEAPEELTLWFDLLQFPQPPSFVAIDSTYLGPAAEGQALLRDFEEIDEILADGRRPLPVAELGSITAEPTEPSPGMSQSELLTSVDEATADQLLSAPIDPLLSVQVRHLGGALARPSDSAAGRVEEPYLLTFSAYRAPRRWRPRLLPVGRASCSRLAQRSRTGRGPTHCYGQGRPLPTPFRPMSWRGCGRSSSDVTRTACSEAITRYSLASPAMNRRALVVVPLHCAPRFRIHPV